MADLDKFERLPLNLIQQVVYLAELLEIAHEEHTEMRRLNGFPPLNDIGRWEDKHSMMEVVAKQQQDKREVSRRYGS
jgi:hypothetical protein